MLLSIVIQTMLILVGATNEGILSHCTSTTSDTCIIERRTTWNKSVGNIVCDNRFPNCFIFCDDADFSCSSTENILIKCPENGNNCIIYCYSTSSCQFTQIMASNTVHTEIVITGYNAGREMMINTSTNTNSTLHINVTSDFFKSIIYSQIGSSLIDINCDSAHLCSENIINGANIVKSVSYCCNGKNVDCSKSAIYCPSSPDSLCNFYCSSCQDTKVYTINGLQHINWQCIGNSISCLNSKLFCGYDEKQSDSINLIYDDRKNQWMFQYGRCKSMTPSTTTSRTDIIYLSNLQRNSNLVNNRTLLEYVVAALLLILCLCCITMIFCCFLQKQQAVQRKIIQHQNIAMEKMKKQSLNDGDIIHHQGELDGFLDESIDDDNRENEEDDNEHHHDAIDGIDGIADIDEYREKVQSRNQTYYITPTPTPSMITISRNSNNTLGTFNIIDLNNYNECEQDEYLESPIILNKIIEKKDIINTANASDSEYDAEKWSIHKNKSVTL